MSGQTMLNARHRNFRSFLTERFTAVAVEVFEEVESIVEAYYEENRSLRNTLRMVLSPQIKLSRIDVSQYTAAAPRVRQQSPKLNTQVNQEISEPPPKKPKEERIECDIGLGSGQQHEPDEADNVIVPVCVKNEQDDEEDSNMPSISDSFHVKVVEWDPDSSATLSSVDGNNYQSEAGSSLDSSAVSDCPQLMRSEESESESPETKIHIRKSKKKKLKMSKKSKCPRQKTLLELPRMMPNKSFIAAPTDCQSFLERLTEAYKDFPDDKKPLITKMGLRANEELVDCAFGKVPKGSPLSYQCPLPSSHDYEPHGNPPPRPPLPLPQHTLEPVSTLPTLSDQERKHVNLMQVNWEEAQTLERSSRGSKELTEELRKLRLTSRFREICHLKPGQSHAEHLIFKIKKGRPKCKTAQLEEELKTEAFRIYCNNACVNWSPCGFVVHPDAPWLGAAPDGLVYDPKERSTFGLVHVKCTSLRSFIDCGFLRFRGRVLQLKSSHSYYWQIQGEMMVTGTSWCDLLVFSREDILVQRIYRDQGIINTMKKKLDDFFFYYYLPSLF